MLRCSILASAAAAAITTASAALCPAGTTDMGTTSDGSAVCEDLSRTHGAMLRVGSLPPISKSAAPMYVDEHTLYLGHHLAELPCAAWRRQEAFLAYAVTVQQVGAAARALATTVPISHLLPPPSFRPAAAPRPRASRERGPARRVSRRHALLAAARGCGVVVRSSTRSSRAPSPSPDSRHTRWRPRCGSSCSWTARRAGACTHACTCLQHRVVQGGGPRQSSPLSFWRRPPASLACCGGPGRPARGSGARLLQGLSSRRHASRAAPRSPRP